MYFSSIVKSRSNQFLEPVLSNEGKVSCSRKKGAFDVNRTNDWLITSQKNFSLRPSMFIY